MELNDFASELLPHTPLLLRLARRVGACDADDLVQETFLRALVARHRYQTGSNGRAWLCRILCNLAISDRRRRARDERMRARVLATTPEPETPEPPPRIDEPALRAALAQLDPAERRILELADVDDLSYREIARALDCPIGTVMSRLHRARRRLRQHAVPARQPAPAHPARTANRRVAA
ncbi:MAG: polymerase sigma-70 factor, subfamily [Myxococcales bacterium]|nr:polymerase sigma-70 factor, subfamily [Myxococcales bacterium]